MLEIQLNNDAYYDFITELEGEKYLFTIKFNPIYETWYADVQGQSNSVSFKTALLPGGDLLEGLSILELGALFLVDIEEEGTNPDEESLGTRHKLLYVTKEEVRDGVIQ